MKKIRSSMQLELEQAKLKLREAELEKNIKKDWKQLKQSLQPVTLGMEIFKNVTDKFKNFFAQKSNEN